MAVGAMFAFRRRSQKLREISTLARSCATYTQQDGTAGRHSVHCPLLTASIHKAVSSDRSSSRVTGQISGVGNGCCLSIVSGSPRRASR